MFGNDQKPGTKYQFDWEPDVRGYAIPVTLINGIRPGKTVLLTAQIHSGEYPGTVALIRLAQKLEPSQVSGRLIIMPLVNISGFYARTHAVLPEDGANLNQNYPGSPDGSPGERIAHCFATKIFPKVDFVLDLHSGDVTETLTPCLFYSDIMESQILPIARYLRVPYLIRSTATTGHYSWPGHHLKIPGILLERGHGGRCLEHWVEEDQRDVLSCLQALGVLPACHLTPYQDQWIMRHSVYLESRHSGLWYPKVEAGQFVKKGQCLGYVEDHFGNLLERYEAQADGIVYYYTHCLAILKGQPLAAYGVVTEMAQIKKHG